MSLKKVFFLGFVFLCFFPGCSKQDQSTKTSLQIVLEDKDSASKSASSESLLAAPTSAAGFQCFAVNITGPGVATQSLLSAKSCSSTDNMRGRGFGILSPIFRRGSTVSMDVPAGKSRTVDVYGIDPPPPECGGSTNSNISSGGYFLGSSIVNITENTTVTVPISFTSGAPSTVSCSGPSSGQPLTLVPTGSTGNGHNIFRNTAGSCFVNSASIVTNVPPNISSMSEIAIGEYSYIGAVDGVTLFTECNWVSASLNTQVSYIAWDLTGINITNFNSFKVTWVGAAGHYSSACNATTTSLGHGGGSSPPLWLVQVWNNSTTTWENVGANLITQSTVANIYTNVSSYKDGANKLWVRIVADDPAAATYCSTVQTDYAELKLIP